MAAAAPAAGFADPVLDAQAVFRAAMDAMSRPGRVMPLSTGLAPPAPLTPELAALALALADGEAPIFLDGALAAGRGVSAYLTFHTGAPVVAAPADAAFALISRGGDLPPAERLSLGSDEYPDRSTTLWVAVDRLEEGAGLAFEGPGIAPDPLTGEAKQARLSVSPLPAGLVEILRGNRMLFPRGIDVILVAPGRLAALPRSVRLVGEA